MKEHTSPPTAMSRSNLSSPPFANKEPTDEELKALNEKLKALQNEAGRMRLAQREQRRARDVARGIGHISEFLSPHIKRLIAESAAQEKPEPPRRMPQAEPLPPCNEVESHEFPELSCRIPLPPNQKARPLTGRWQRMSHEALERVYQAKLVKGCGTGWRLDNLLVLDTDSAEATDWIENTIHFGNLPETVSIDTRRGRHYLYRSTRAFKSKCDIGLEQNVKMNLLTGRSCYIIAVGCTVDDVKRTWTPKRGPSDIEIASLDEQEVGLIQRWVARTKQIKPQRESMASTKPRRPQSALEHDYEHGVELGRRDNMCAALVIRLHRRLHTRREIMDMLLMWNQRNRPPWPEQEEEKPCPPDEWIAGKIERLCRYKPVMYKRQVSAKQQRCEDAVAQWAGACLDFDPHSWVDQWELIGTFICWAQEKGLGEWTAKRVGPTIRALLPVWRTEYNDVKNNVMHYRRLHGIRLRESG